MAIKKDLIVVALATFCLAATLFMVVPTRSNPGTSNGPNQWADINDDGTVDIYDAIILSGSFGASVDPIKNVNVTNPRAKTVETDLNISLNYDRYYNPLGYGWNSTDVFATEGYTTMFIRFAIVDISNYTYAYPYYPTRVIFSGARWPWGVFNGSNMETYTPLDYNKALSAWVWDPAVELPASTPNSTDFRIEGPQCSLAFRAYSPIWPGWILIRVSVFLTEGTASPPSVQDTAVTNWPARQPEPSYGSVYRDLNVSILNGYGAVSMYFDVGGYSRIFVSFRIINASYQGVPVATTVYLNSIYWEPFGGWQSIPLGTLNATYDGVHLPVNNQQVPAEFSTRGSSCNNYFSISSGVISGWVEFEVNVYLRNE